MQSLLRTVESRCAITNVVRPAIADPPVLILDEATSSIDTRTEKIVQDGMDKLMVVFPAPVLPTKAIF